MLITEQEKKDKKNQLEAKLKHLLTRLKDVEGTEEHSEIGKGLAEVMMELESLEKVVTQEQQLIDAFNTPEMKQKIKNLLG